MEKQNKNIYILNRVPPEKVLIHLVQLSELVQTTPSVNYTHLQNLTRSLAKKKKKIVGTIFLSGLKVGKLKVVACPFLCNHSNGTRKEKNPVLKHEQYVYLTFNIIILPQLYRNVFPLCVFCSYSLSCLNCNDSLHLWNFFFVFLNCHLTLNPPTISLPERVPRMVLVLAFALLQTTLE